MIVYVESLKELTKAFLELISNYSKFVEYRINIQKSITSPGTKKEQVEFEIENTITLTDGNYTYHSEHFVLYVNIKSLCHIPATNIILYVYYMPINFLNTIYIKTKKVKYLDINLTQCV